MLELCPVCKELTAERSHYTDILICYSRTCGYREPEYTVEQKIEALKNRVKVLEDKGVK